MPARLEGGWKKGGDHHETMVEDDTRGEGNVGSLIV